MSTTARVESRPDCDLCQSYGQRTSAVYDARTRQGAWAYLCLRHFSTHTEGRLGTGYGQRLVVEGEERPTPKRHGHPHLPEVGDEVVVRHGASAWNAALAEWEGSRGEVVGFTGTYYQVRLSDGDVRDLHWQHIERVPTP
ncbi:hypothetical protein [Nocardioides massiliensis]|uniref:Ribosomal protein L21E n=1 Tax=Nocardioides massiliensis TaxID=1325935 RepID=A0ABT9NKV4_9ACTN|nr:hypothetical protein [Nocardioides massiliensis]MDP9821048.1 ribosomal protein L21E [Nocardioides massiliensis]